MKKIYKAPRSKAVDLKGQVMLDTSITKYGIDDDNSTKAKYRGFGFDDEDEEEYY